MCLFDKKLFMLYKREFVRDKKPSFVHLYCVAIEKKHNTTIFFATLL